ncbi:MAG: ABC transporter ATP-binding protein, partial [Spirochaetaceae bacterium]
RVNREEGTTLFLTTQYLEEATGVSVELPYVATGPGARHYGRLP